MTVASHILRDDARDMVRGQLAELARATAAFDRQTKAMPKPSGTKKGFMRHMKRAKKYMGPLALSRFRATPERFNVIYALTAPDHHGQTGILIRSPVSHGIIGVRYHALIRAFERCGYRALGEFALGLPLRWLQWFQHIDDVQRGDQVFLPMRDGSVAVGTWWQHDDGSFLPIVSTVLANDMLDETQRDKFIRIAAVLYDDPNPPAFPVLGNERPTDEQREALQYIHKTAIRHPLSFIKPQGEQCSAFFETSSTI